VFQQSHQAFSPAAELVFGSGEGEIVMTKCVALGFLAVAAVMEGCSGLPTAPSELTDGIAIYERANFLGKSALVKSSIGDLDSSDGPCKAVDTIATILSYSGTVYSHSWDDCISSIRVTPGWRAIVYRDPDFHGSSVEIVSDVVDLQQLAATLITVGEYRQASGGPVHLGALMSHEISSIRVFPPY
jgi:hypothetical protein